MKALTLRNGGNIRNLQIEEVNIPTISKHEVLIKVDSVSLNLSDYQTIEYLGELQSPIILGLDIAGEVVEVGDEVRDVTVGERVFYLRKMNNPYGGFAEYAVSESQFLARIPDNISYTEAAALPGAGMTAYHIMKERFHLKEGKTILIHGGAGGVGSYLIQLAKLHGLTVITTCSAYNFSYVKELGADIAIDYKTENVSERIMELTNGFGVEYIVNTVSGESAKQDMELLKVSGEIALVAGMPTFDHWNFFEKGISVHEIAFGVQLTSEEKEIQKTVAKVGNEIAILLAAGKIKAPKINKITLEEVPGMLEMMKQNKVVGKVVAKI